MALIKEKPIDKIGATGSYWIPAQTNIGIIDDNENMVMMMYTSEEWKKENNGNPTTESESFTDLEIREMPISDIDMEGVLTVKDLVRKAFYTKLKARASEEKAKKDAEEDYDEKIEWWSDATDSI